MSGTRIPNYLLTLIFIASLLPGSALTENRGLVSNSFNVKLALVAKGLHTPVATALADDGTNRVFIVEQTGKVRIFDANSGTLTKRPFFNLKKRLPSGEFIATQYETGLLGLVFHPQYAANGRFFAFYTDKAVNIVVAEFKVSESDPNHASARPVNRLLYIKHPEFYNHFGGAMAFGPDGYLYIGVADGGGTGDPYKSGQDLNSLKGKILRIDVDGAPENGKHYAIPDDNPFAHNHSASPEVYAYGFRNPWRISFDPETGRLYAADVGQYRKEEIDLVVPGGNYGWNIMEGSICFGSRTEPIPHCNKHGLTVPIAEYDRPKPFRYSTTAIIGGYVYRGAALPELTGHYIFADFTNGFMRSISENDDGTWAYHELFKNMGFMVSSFAIDENNEHYVLAYDRGALYKLVPNS